MTKEKLEFIPFQEQDLEVAFNFYQSTLYEVIENVFGWNDSFQRNRFETHYKLEWFSWIEIGSKRIGYICYFEKETELHLSLLIIFDKLQSKGYGKIVMSKIEQYALKQNKKITLSSFKANKGAVKFYKSMGYVITSEDEHFLDLSNS